MEASQVPARLNLTGYAGDTFTTLLSFTTLVDGVSTAVDLRHLLTTYFVVRQPQEPHRLERAQFRKLRSLRRSDQRHVFGMLARCCITF